MGRLNRARTYRVYTWFNRVMTAEGQALNELRAGVTFWRTHPKWPQDLHNQDYEKWDRENSNGNFTSEWWHRYQLPKLKFWIATRPVSAEVLTRRFEASIPSLRTAWQAACLPHLKSNISMVAWEDVAAFPDEVAKIKPMKAGTSAVFTSKFCHFLLPSVFPVVDNEALGNGWPSYETYFKWVQTEWAATDTCTRDLLIAELTRMIGECGPPVFAEFPVINKIVELRLMGRRHPERQLEEAGSSG